MKIKLLPHFCNKFNRKELLLFLSALFINMNLIAQSPRECLPSDKDPNYDAKKKSLIKTGGDTTNTAAIPKSTTNLPVCFEPFDNTGGDGWQMTPRNDDGSLGPVALGWDFSLYGTIYDQVYINTNGNISFLSGVRQFSPSGFPIGIPMIAAFWADVDTRPSESGAVWFKVFSDRLVVTWDHVGYYEVQTDKTNTFQMIIYANTNPAFKGNDVIFAYGDMQWTTGSASGGVGGFGGSAATVGANNGNGIDYIQTGRFNINSSDAPNSGGAGTPGGVSWLDDKCFGYVVCRTRL